MNQSCPLMADRTGRTDWDAVALDLDARGYATVGASLTPEECDAMAGLYDRDAGFRSTVVMARHGSAAANIGISLIRCRLRSTACGARSTRGSRPSP